MFWVLLLAVGPGTFAVDSVYTTQAECEAVREIEMDKCWPANILLVAPPDGTYFEVIKYD